MMNMSFKRLAGFLVLCMVVEPALSIGAASRFKSLQDTLSQYFDKYGCADGALKCFTDFPIIGPDCNDVKDLAWCLFDACTTLKDSDNDAVQVARLLVEFAKDQYDCQATVDQFLRKGDKPSGSGGQPSGSGGQPSGSGGQPSGSGGQPSGSAGQPSGSGEQPSGSAGQPSGSGGQPSGSGGQPSGSGGQPSGSGGQPTGNGSVGIAHGSMFGPLMTSFVIAMMMKKLFF